MRRLSVLALAMFSLSAGWAEGPDLGSAYEQASNGFVKPFQASASGFSAKLEGVDVPYFRWDDQRANSARYNFGLFDGTNEASQQELKALVERFQALALESYAPVDRFCREKTGVPASLSFDDLYTKNVVFLKNISTFEVRRGGENAGIGAKNTFLFLPRLLEKGLFYGVYRLDRLFTGYETFKEVPGNVELYNKLKPAYSVKLDPAAGWQHFGWLSGDEVKTIYIAADEASMKRALVGHFRKDVCVYGGGPKPDWSQVTW